MIEGEMMNNIYELVSINIPHTEKDALLINTNEPDKYINIIRDNNIVKVRILEQAQSIDFLEQCQNIRHVSIQGPFNYEPLYKLKNLLSLHINTMSELNNRCSEIDLSQFKTLIDVGIVYNHKVKNLPLPHTVKSLFISKYNREDLTEFRNFTQIDQLHVITSKIKTLNGIENFRKLKAIYLDYNRNLSDIAKLEFVGNTLSALHIDTCNKIESLIVLEKLFNLRHLFLLLNIEIDNLNFIYKLKSLSTFIFNILVKDGNLNPCLELDYVYCDKMKRHYNLRDRDLPRSKNLYDRGNTEIDEWRRRY